MKRLSVWLSSRKRRLLAGVSLFFLLLAVLCLYRSRFSPLEKGITVGGLEVGGLTPVQARQTLESALEETLLTQELPVHLPEEALTLTSADCGFQVQTGKAILAARHSQANTEISLLPYLTADQETIRGKLEAYATQYDTVLTQPVWRTEGEAPDLSTEHFSSDTPGQTLVVTMGVPELHLDCDAVFTQILCTASDAITLCKSGQYRVTPEITPETLPLLPNALAIAGEYYKDPVSDSVDRETCTLIPGSYGTCVDAKLLTRQIRRAEYGEHIRIPLQYLPPEVLGDEAFFLDVLGAYETRYTANFNRIHNLELQCEALDGLVVQPGETFSMNGVLGERTTERGYLPAPAYSGNRLTQSPGGGVCQGTTTLYNCVLLADLEVVFRACHGVKVGYVPLGLDAAVNWLTTDFQFRNNFQCPIQIRARLEDGYMKMEILGIDEKDYYIKMEARSGEDDIAYYARSYKCKYDKDTNELISREVEAYSTYYKNIG